MNESFELEDYPGIPAEQKSSFRDAVEIPDELRSWLPSPSTPISTLVKTPFPKISAGIKTTNTNSWFKADLPTTDVRVLQDRPVPDLETLAQLVRKLEIAWMQGSRSISDPRYNDGQDRLPLYAVTYWNTVKDFVRQQILWKEAAGWVNDRHGEWVKMVGKGELVKDLGVFERFSRLSISSRVPMRWGAGPVDMLARFLGEKWMETNNMEFMLDRVVKRIADDPKKRGKIWVMPPNFSQAILEYSSSDRSTAARGARFLQRYEEDLSQAGKIFAPFNVNGYHWVAVCLDLTTSSLVYGDSLAASNTVRAPKSEMKALKKWSEERLGKKVKIGGDELKHAIQEDNHSCGLITINTIEVNIFGDRLWAPSTAAENRLLWFNMGAHLTNPRMTRQAVTPMAPHPKHTLQHVLNDDDDNTTAWGTLGLSEQTARGTQIEVSAPEPAAEDESITLDPTTGSGAAEQSDVAGAESATVEADAVDDALEQGSVVSHDAMSIDVPTATLKRPRSPSADSVLPGAKKPAVRKMAASLVAKASGKKRKSESYAKEKREGTKNGTLTLDDPKIARQVKRWRETLLGINPLVKFDDNDLYAYWHPACSDWRHVKQLGDVTRFREHDKHCKPGQSSTLHTFWKVSATSARASGSSSKSVETRKAPCPGLQATDDSRIGNYLARTGASGGGGRNPVTLAKEIFSTVFSKLKIAQKKEILAEQRNTHKWSNDYQNLSVFSTSCKKHVVIAVDRANPPPCSECAAVRELPAFVKAISRPLPSKENKKYINKRYLNEVLGRRYAESKGLQDLRAANDAVNHNQKELNMIEDMTQIDEVDHAVGLRDLVVSEPTMPLGLGSEKIEDLDLSALVSIRRAHQTEQAAKCARTRSAPKAKDPENDIPSTGHTPPADPDDEDAVAAQTVAETRKEIVKKFREIVREKQNHAPGSGKARADRWTEGGDNDVSSDVIPTLTGNAANAAVVAASNASKTATKRKNVFQIQKAPFLNHIAGARVTAVRPLRCGDFVFIISGPKSTTVSIGKVVTMYSRTAGKNARNAVVYEAQNISALSRLAVQVFERSFQRQFTPLPAATSTLSTHQFLLIPPIQALFLLLEPVFENDGNLQLSQTDFDCWKILKQDIAKIQEGIKLFKKRGASAALERE